MRKLGIGLIIFIVLIVVALLVVPSFINVNTYHSRIQSELQQKLGRQVSFGTMHLKLLPPKLRVDNLMIADDPRFSTTAPFAQAGDRRHRWTGFRRRGVRTSGPRPGGAP